MRSALAGEAARLDTVLRAWLDKSYALKRETENAQRMYGRAQQQQAAINALLEHGTLALPEK